MEQPHSIAWYRFFYILKFPATATFGLLMTLASLYLMQYLIDTGEKALDETPNFNMVDFVRMKQDIQVRV